MSKVFSSLLVFLCLFGTSCRETPALDSSAPPATAPIESQITATAQEARPAPDQLFGELFRRVQLERVFADGKTFVDMVPKRDARAIMADYAEESRSETFDLKTFVEANFDPPASPESGYRPDPNRPIVAHIDSLWSYLTREAGTDEGDAGSLLPLPNDYIVPGGRFREVYYWDSYFTCLGLVEAGRVDLVRDMVENFAHLIDTYGFVPNGNRSYYLTRSQPPFFVFMVELLARYEDGGATVEEFLPQLRKEYAFWMDGQDRVNETNIAVNHVVRMPDGSLLNRYYDAGDRPRAESYHEDVLAIRESGRDSNLVARHLRSGAESGWDYSVRWFEDGKNISSIVTTDIVPPDLNSLLWQLEQTLGTYTESGEDGENEFANRAEARWMAMEKYLWNPETSWYEDYNFRKEQPTGRLSLAGMYPFWVQDPGYARNQAGAGNRMEEAVEVLKEQFLAPGGLRATPYTSGQQWDAPNGWPPLQYISVMALRKFDQRDLAEQVTDRWLRNNERVYENVTKMVEKYNVEDITLEAGGGEYPVQDGFGWSNGVYRAFARE